LEEEKQFLDDLKKRRIYWKLKEYEDQKTKYPIYYQ